jgi:hypothetical protein
MIGAIVAEWSLAESFLSEMYGLLVCGPTLDGVPQHQGTWVAMETFDMISDFQQRRSMLLAAAERRGFDDSTIKHFKKKLSVMQDACDKRIVAAHGWWLISDDFSTGLVWFRNLGASSTDAVVYEQADFIDNLDRITKATTDLQAYFRETMMPMLKTQAESLVAVIVARKSLDSPGPG